MTTKTSKLAAPFLPYKSLLPEGYICPEPEYRVDSLLQSEHIDECGHILRDHFSEQPTTLVDTGAFVFYDINDMPRRRFRPDLYAVFGIDKAAAYRRNGYIIEEAGKPPDFALEVASPTTYRYDLGGKRTLYASIGIVEYWRFDPTGGELYGQPLIGETLIGGTYQALDLHTEPDGMVWGYSPALDLCLCALGRRLLFYDRKTGCYLRSVGEERAARLATEAERDQFEAERDAAVAEAERLREELRRLRSQ